MSRSLCQIILCIFSAATFSGLPAILLAEDLDLTRTSEVETTLTEIQNRLDYLGCNPGSITGTLTSETLAALGRFVDASEYDRSRRLSATNLLSLLNVPSAPICSQQDGSPNQLLTDIEITERVQAELNRLGCTLGPADGIVGGRSVAALRAFIDSSRSNFSYNVLLFKDVSFLNSLKSLGGPVCLTAPIPASYDLSGVWRLSFSCPNTTRFDGEAEIYQRSGNSYRIRYYDQGGAGSGTATLAGTRITGSLNYKGDVSTFQYRLSADGTTVNGTTSRSCMVNGRRISR